MKYKFLQLANETFRSKASQLLGRWWLSLSPKAREIKRVDNNEIIVLNR